MFLKKYFFNSEFNKNVFTLITGSSVAQIISLLLAPILSRIYTPYEFGIFGTFAAFVSGIAILITLRYDLAIILPKNKADAINIFALSVFLAFILSLVLEVFICLLIFFFPEYFTPQIKNIFYYVPIGTFLMGFYHALTCWANRNKDYKNIVRSRIANSGITGSLNLGLGAFNFLQWGLIVGFIGGYLFSTGLMLKLLYSDLKEYKSEIKIDRIKAMASTYKDFPQSNSIQGVVDMLQVNGIIYFLSFTFKTSVVGAYTYAIRILQVPVSFIGTAVSQVFYRQASEAFYNSPDLEPSVKKIIKRTALIGLPSLLIILIYGPEIFSFVFGEKWRIAGEYAQILSPWIYLDFIRSPISQVPLIKGTQKKILPWTLGSAFLLIVIIGLAGYFFKDSPPLALMIITAYQCAQTIFFIYFFIKLSKVEH